MTKELERLSNSELQKLNARDGVGKQVWERRSHKIHLDNLRKLHQQARGINGRKEM